MSTISHSTGSFSPTAITSWSTDSEARTIVHTIMGRTDPDITLRPGSLRTGTLELVFSTAQESFLAAQILRTPDVFVLTGPDVPQAGMTFVVARGSVSESQGSAQEWTVRVPFQEVSV